MIRVEIRRQVQSANAFVNRRGFGGSQAYRKDRDAWRVLLRAALTPREKPNHPVRVQVISYRGRELDHANLVGGCKGLIDGLVDLGYARDDKPKWFSATYDQITPTPKRDARTVLIIHDHA